MQLGPTQRDTTKVRRWRRQAMLSGWFSFALGPTPVPRERPPKQEDDGDWDSKAGRWISGHVFGGSQPDFGVLAFWVLRVWLGFLLAGHVTAQLYP